MRLWLIYLFRNMTRNPLRTALTCAAVGLPIIIYVLSTAVIDGVERFLNNSAKQLRLVVMDRATFVNPLPVGYRAKIEALGRERPGLRSVCGLQWIGGQVEGKNLPLSTLAVDADAYPATFPEYPLTAEQRQAWQRDRQALIVGASTAGQLGWKVGDRVTITPSLPPYKPMEFHIIADSGDAPDPNTNFCRRDYYVETLKEAGGRGEEVSFFFIKCDTLADLDHYRVAIDKQFAGSPNETKTQDERTFMSGFITQQFNLPRNLGILSAVTVFVAVMAAANTMSMNFRDRLNEFATLRSIGFGGRYGVSLVQFESLLVCTFGGVVGAAIPFVLFTYTPLADFTVPIILNIDVDPLVCVKAVGIALMVGLVAGLWPAWLAARMRVIDALRSLE